MLSANHQTTRFINQQYLKKKKKKMLDFICPLIQIHENEKLDG